MAGGSASEGGRGGAGRVLVIEDEASVSAFVQRGLEQSDYQVAVAASGEEGLRLLDADPFDFVILDVMLPGMDGLAVLRELRRRTGENGPAVLALTARAGLDDRIAGLDAGCDDYLPKPFAFQELLARLRALGRRARSSTSRDLVYADLSLDPTQRIARRGSRSIELTNREFALLHLMMQQPETPFTRQQLLEKVWGYDWETDSNVVEVYMNFLRKKIDAGGPCKLLHTVRGVGYILRREEG
jgi:DNA-binding response OmpR family regulator